MSKTSLALKTLSPDSSLNDQMHWSTYQCGFRADSRVN